jgi:hypothetical protein
MADESPDSPHIIPIGGTGRGSVLQLSSKSWKFRPLLVGSASDPATITIHNPGPGTVTFREAQITEENGPNEDFELLPNNNTCYGPLAPGATCTVTFNFKPFTSGERSGSIQLGDNSIGGPLVIPIRGRGVSWLKISNKSWDFGGEPVGQASCKGVIYVYNRGPQAVQTQFGITGQNASDFSVMQENCTPALSPYTTCAVSLNFTPSAAGDRAASFHVYSSSAPYDTVIPLHGYSYNPQ